MIGAILAAYIALPAAAAAQEAGAMQFGVNPQVGPPGARFAFVAFGFDDDERVGVWLNTPDGRAIEADAEELNSANDDGRADWYITMPADAQRGVWQAVARGIDSGVERVIPFEVRGDMPAATMDSNVSPQVGPPGARFAFAAFGFDDDERVGVWLNAPDGRVVEADAEDLNSANGDGRADWYITMPADAQRGVWQAVARGIDSGVERVIPFEVR
jgi:hypothetical protein